MISFLQMISFYKDKAASNVNSNKAQCQSHDEEILPQSTQDQSLQRTKE